jgi:hypothetical protein
MGECIKQVQRNEWDWTSEEAKRNWKVALNFGLMDRKLLRFGAE